MVLVHVWLVTMITLKMQYVVSVILHVRNVKWEVEFTIVQHVIRVCNIGTQVNSCVFVWMVTLKPSNRYVSNVIKIVKHVH